MVLKNSDAATISDLVYKNPVEEINNGYNNDYTFLESSAYKDSAEGFFGAVFEKDNNIVIAFRGTNNPFNDPNGESILKKIKQFSRDLEDDLFFALNRWGVSSKVMPQYKEALDFSKAVQAKYGVNKEIIITGHSLGGGLAQLVGIELKHKVISFDSPGALSIARNLFSQDRINAHKSLIVSYATAPNFFNTVGKPIVDPIQINVKTSAYNSIEPNALGFIGQKVFQFIEFRYFEYSREQHSSKHIYQAFSPISGEPVSIVIYDKWPTWYEAYEQFHSHCVLENDPKEDTDGIYPNIFEVLEIFSDNEISDSKLSNTERFQKLAESQRASGNEVLGESFTHMADQTQAVLDALDNKQPNNNGFQFDSSIFDHAKKNFHLDRDLLEEEASDEEDNPLASFHKIMDIVSKQSNNDPSLNNIDLLKQLSTDRENDDDHEFGDLFASLADQTAAAMKVLGIDLNEDYN